MIGKDVFDAFDKDNVLRRKEWRKWAARAAGTEVRRRLSGRVVVVLGNETWSALALPKADWFGSTTTGDTTWHKVPHPSGLNAKYNDLRCVSKVKDLMWRIVNEA